jgi:hypothetical protein
MEMTNTTGNSNHDEIQINHEILIATNSACCWNKVLGTISPMIRIVGIMTITATTAPLAAPNMDINKTVATVVLVTTHRLVPLNVVERNHSGLPKSLRVITAEREPLFAFCLILLTSDETRASSPPENRPSRHINENINRTENKLSIDLFLSLLNPYI